MKAQERFQAIVYIDVDDVSDLNASLGFEVTNNILAELEQMIVASIRGAGDLLNKKDDEYIVVVEGRNESQLLKCVREMLSNIISHEFCVAGDTVTVSAGIALIRRDADPDAAKKNAFQAMCRSKYSGKSRFTVWPSPLSQTI